MTKDKDMFERITHRILEQMKAQGLKANGLSERAGMDRGYIRGLERGLNDPSRSAVPKRPTLKKLAHILECSVEYLACETDHPDGTGNIHAPARIAPSAAPSTRHDLTIAGDALQDLTITAVEQALTLARENDLEFQGPEFAKLVAAYARILYEVKHDDAVTADMILPTARAAMGQVIRGLKFGA